MSRKVVVGMPGGVDSSMAAWLLKQQGYDVIGVTTQIWQDEDTDAQEAEGGCCGLNAVDDTRRVTMSLSIPYYVMNFREKLRKNVVDYFVGEYVEGKTPNPYIACNRYVKWESLLRRSMAIGADYTVTGHYAQIEQLPNSRYALKTSVTVEKDQTYAPYNLTQDQLAHTLMPVGSFCRDEIRRMARDIGFQVVHKSDSQKIRSIPDHDYASFTEEYTGEQIPKGSFADPRGNILDRHEGISHYTIGQCKGLNFSMGYPVFVVETRPETSEVVIGEGKDAFTNVLRCSKLNWMAVDGLHEQAMEAIAKIRYSHRGAPCAIREIGPNLVERVFHEPVRATTSSQTAVPYQGDHVAGGGTIVRK